MLGTDISNNTLASAKWHFTKSSPVLTVELKNFGAREHAFRDIVELLKQQNGNLNNVEKATLSGHNTFAVRGEKNISIIARWATHDNLRVYRKLRDAHVPEDYFEPPAVAEEKIHQPSPSDGLKNLVNSATQLNAETLQVAEQPAQENDSSERKTPLQMLLFPERRGAGEIKR